jgi:hypothetical protein
MSLSNNALGLWRKVIASRSNRSEHSGADIATCSYRSDNILAVIASEIYCSDN